MSTTQAYSDVLKDIQDFYVENSQNVHIPTFGKDLKYKTLSVQQLKKFIELQVSSEKDEYGVLPSLDIVDQINKIVIDNCIDGTEDLLDKLTTLDRDCIIAQLRAYSKDTIDVNSSEQGDVDSFSISHILKEVRKNKLPARLKKREHVIKFKSGCINLTLRLPSVSRDSYINRYFKSQVAPLFKESKARVKNNIERILSQTYFVELCKYIDTLEVHKGDSETVVRFDNHDTITQQIKLLEQLPTDIVVHVNEFVKNLKEYKDSTLYYVNGDNRKVPLTIDVNLFTTI